MTSRIAPLAQSLLPFMRLGLSVVTLGGCVLIWGSPPNVSDLRIERVIGGSRVTGERDLMVIFSTPHDLGRYMRDFSATVVFETWSCAARAAGDQRLLDAGMINTEDGVRSVDGVGFDIPAPPSGSDGRFRYSFDLAPDNGVRLAFPNARGPVFARADLRQQAVDVCFHIQGGSYSGRHRSPVFRIPAAMIAEALARAQ